MSTQDLLDAALALPRSQRAELTEKLAASLEPPSEIPLETWQQAWAGEVGRRLAEIDAGQVEPIDDDEVWAEVEQVLAATAG